LYEKYEYHSEHWTPWQTLLRAFFKRILSWRVYQKLSVNLKGELYSYDLPYSVYLYQFCLNDNAFCSSVVQWHWSQKNCTQQYYMKCLFPLCLTLWLLEPLVTTNMLRSSRTTRRGSFPCDLVPVTSYFVHLYCAVIGAGKTAFSNSTRKHCFLCP